MTSMTIFALVLLAMCAGTYGVTYQNDWDDDHYKQCNAGESVSRIQSVHDNGKEDRRWRVDCQNTGATDDCVWTADLNGWDEDIFYLCQDNRVITGWASRHNNGKEDRIFQVQCCRKPNTPPSNCVLTNWANDWDQKMDFQTGANKGITAMFSVHDNNKEDRRWKFIVCDYV